MTLLQDIITEILLFGFQKTIGLYMIRLWLGLLFHVNLFWSYIQCMAQFCLTAVLWIDTLLKIPSRLWSLSGFVSRLGSNFSTLKMLPLDSPSFNYRSISWCNISFLNISEDCILPLPASVINLLLLVQAPSVTCSLVQVISFLNFNDEKIDSNLHLGNPD